jgi:propionyl-CoA synthetase
MINNNTKQYSDEKEALEGLVMHNEQAEELRSHPNISSKKYDTIYQESINPTTREQFWERISKEVSWFQEPTTILDSSNEPFHHWFSDGKINMAYNCIDVHIKEKRGEMTALIWESAYLNASLKITYNQLHENVSRLTEVFMKLNVKTGDTVIIYMPMIPEAIYGMLACARLGAIHSVVFGGFAAPELADRIRDCNPSLILTASVGIEPRKRIKYYPIVTEAMKIDNYKCPLIIYQREDVEIETQFDEEYDNYIYQDIIKDTKGIIDCVPVPANHPLYILYTSGTTGSPKGIVRDTGGTAVVLNYELRVVMDVEPGDVYFSSSDIGWVVGHSFIVYGPLIRGASTIIFEGKPVGTPHPAKFWEIIEKHNVKVMYTAPTALRAIKREDYDFKEMSKYNISSLKSVHMAGERCDPQTLTWIQNGLTDKVLINDNWWQTETGWSICSNNIRIHTFPTLPGSTCRPLPGFDIVIYDNDILQEKKEKNSLGLVYIRLPMPPSFMLTLWKNDEAFKAKYISKDNKYYITGDAGYIDSNGYLHIMTRIDDIINVAGHRLSTGRMEEVIIKVEDVVEAAVVSVEDELKGELPFAFVVCKPYIVTNEQIAVLKKNVLNQVVHCIGAISRLKDAIIVNRLPKTRSGKILRGTLKKILNKINYKIPSTIEDASVLDDIIELLKIHKHL